MIANKSEAAHEVFNVGTGVGYTVLEVINAFEKENQIKLNYTIGKRREGDAQAIFADATKANSILQWKTEKDLKDMVIDSWRWEKGLKSEVESKRAQELGLRWQMAKNEMISTIAYASVSTTSLFLILLLHRERAPE